MTKHPTRRAKRPSKKDKENLDKSSVAAPNGFGRKKPIAAAEPHMLVATTSSFMGPPPFICVPTGPPPNPCLRYSLDPNTGQYSIPPSGKLMDCAACRAGASASTASSRTG